MSINDLPLLNACLNGACAILLLIARQAIRNDNRPRHKTFMIAAFSVSVVFLGSYLFYHFNAGVVKFDGQGWIRPVYFVLLTSHTILAVTVPVLATMTLMRGLKARYQLHKKIARWTYPIWMYVSVTGVIIYVMLYQIYPHSV